MRFCPLSPTIGTAFREDSTVGERAGVRGTHRMLQAPHPHPGLVKRAYWGGDWVCGEWGNLLRSRVSVLSPHPMRRSATVGTSSFIRVAEYKSPIRVVAGVLWRSRETHRHRHRRRGPEGAVWPPHPTLSPTVESSPKAASIVGERGQKGRVPTFGECPQIEGCDLGTLDSIPHLLDSVTSCPRPVPPARFLPHSDGSHASSQRSLFSVSSRA